MNPNANRNHRRQALRTVLRLSTLGAMFVGAAHALAPAGEPIDGKGETYGIRVLPERVYPSAVYTLRLETTDPGVAKRFWSWSASRGEILSDGESGVYWKSPSKAGDVKIHAVEIGAEGKSTDRRAEIDVVVHEPSREGMVLVPAGTFVMGDSWTEEADPFFIPTFQNMNDKPPHRVYLGAYWIDRNKVTNRQYADYLREALRQGFVRLTPEAVLGIHEGVETPFYYFEIGRPDIESGTVPFLARAIRWRDGEFEIEAGFERHPVMDVTWAGAVEYARFHGKRLPSEAEWEKATRGVGVQQFPWGNQLPTKYHANLNAPRRNETAAVGSHSPTGDSPYGVADALGGFEWVNDWFGRFYYRDNYSELPVDNPRGPEWGVDRAVRGVSRLATFRGDRQYMAPLGFRYQWIFEFGHGLIFAHDDTGFRTAMRATKEEAERAGDSDRRSAVRLRPQGKFPLPRKGYKY